MRALGLVVASSLVALSLGCAAGAQKDPVEPDVSTDDAALSTKLARMNVGDSPTVAFDGSQKWFGFVFHGTAGEAIDVYAKATYGKIVKGKVDPVLYLYKVSKTTGKTTGHALAYDDDTSHTDWTSNDTDSSIDAFTLPETRDYAVLVRAYDLSMTGLVQVAVMDDASSAPIVPFAGTGAAVSISFGDLAVQRLALSNDVDGIQGQATSKGWELSAARLFVTPKTLSAIVKDPARFGAFGYDVMYYAASGATTSDYHGPANVSPLAAKDAVFEFQGASTDTMDITLAPLRASEQQLVDSMLGDGDFASGAANVYKTHWDNSDDTSADGVMAVDLATGEVRAVTYVNPP